MVGKKKRGHPDIEELLARPWCYYCERDFDDLKILISHQKAKHFKCERCGRRLNTAGGLSVHMNQVHKETLASVDNSLPNRQGLEVEIFGMEGIPEDVVQAHNQRIIAGFYQAEQDRRAATGNPAPGTANAGGGQSKKPKVESPADLKKRLAEHKARKAEQAANGGSGGTTPLDAGISSAASPLAATQSPGAFNNSPFPPPQSSYGATQGAGYGSFSQEPYSQPAAAYQQPYNQQPPFSGPPGPAYQPQYSPPQYPPNAFQPPPYGAGSPPPGSFNGYQPPPSHTPPTHGGLPNRPPSLPPAPGLPQRPSFGAPPIPPYQMQQMHQKGGWNGNGWNGQDQNSATSSAYPHPPGLGEHSTNASTVDDLVSGAARDADDDIDKIIRMAEAGIKPPNRNSVDLSKTETTEAVAAPESVAQPGPQPEAKTEVAEKKSKKDKPMKMIYSDNEVSPEEKMAKMPRYAFVPDGKIETSLEESVAAVTVNN
ncbi:uncharacterized protein EAE98_009933 [Botrytis deweyae]|uniref:C2H2-type domain-containing protein n=1 Tax=Botrytis deweyae TaxID=2478750 RepID=A0ABQ7IA11_9HELO|nr:uncharacterized protein EAE98_009933 [Botrytis deweyae]KAF7917905.1 hypothetical protein EAE98_009933 [Botrytis deweyae]